MTEIAGKVAFITGGGSGIGRGLALALASEGASVVVADIIKDNGDKVAAEIKAAGGKAASVACDVTDRSSVRNAQSEATKALGKVSILVANAGVTFFDRLIDMSDADVDWIIQGNLMGVTNCLRAFLPDMVASRAGHVLATASTAGIFPDWIPYHGPYSAAKAGVVGMMLNIRVELEEVGVGCTVYCPGGVKTSLRANNNKYRPAQFGGPTNEPLRGNEDWLKKNKDKLNFLTPETAAKMVIQSIKKNRPIVLDHSNQRDIFMERYVNPMLAAYDEAEAFESSLAQTAQ